MTKRLVDLGGAPLIQTPEAFGEQIKAENGVKTAINFVYA